VCPHRGLTATEPDRKSGRLQLLREWSNEAKIHEVFPRGDGARCAHGRGIGRAAGIHWVTTAIESVAAKIGCTSETLRRWVGQRERDTGKREGATTSEQERLKALEREVKELRKANEILRLASAFFAQAELDRRFKS